MPKPVGDQHAAFLRAFNNAIDAGVKPDVLAAFANALADVVAPTAEDRAACPEIHSQVCFNGMDAAASMIRGLAAAMEVEHAT